VTADDLEAAGFVRDAEGGRFFTLDAAGRVARFGARRSDGDGFLKQIVIAIDWAAQTASREDLTRTGFPDPDADPTIRLEQHLAGWRDELVQADTFRQVCAFCGKSNTEVARLIAGPSAMICNECVALCQEILTA
jgi:hypothetical protein